MRWVRYGAMRCGAILMRCGVVRCGAVWCGWMQCSAVWCGAVRCMGGVGRTRDAVGGDGGSSAYMKVPAEAATQVARHPPICVCADAMKPGGPDCRGGQQPAERATLVPRSRGRVGWWAAAVHTLLVITCGAASKHDSGSELEKGEGTGAAPGRAAVVVIEARNFLLNRERPAIHQQLAYTIAVGRKLGKSRCYQRGG